MIRNKVLITLFVVVVIGYILWKGLAGVMRGVTEMERNMGGANQAVKDNQGHRIQKETERGESE